jgi:hypothetical protein
VPLREHWHYEYTPQDHLNADGPWMNDVAIDNKYQYNGEEIDNDPFTHLSWVVLSAILPRMWRLMG